MQIFSVPLLKHPVCRYLIFHTFMLTPQTVVHLQYMSLSVNLLHSAFLSAIRLKSLMLHIYLSYSKHFELCYKDISLRDINCSIVCAAIWTEIVLVTVYKYIKYLQTTECKFYIHNIYPNYWPPLPHTFQRETASETSCFLLWTLKLFQKGLYSKKKEFAPEGKFFV